MEKFYYYSDLHNERTLNYSPNSPYQEDLFKFPEFSDMSESNLILAGDIDETGKESHCERYAAFLEKASSLYKRVFVVFGNHCHYGNSIFRSKVKFQPYVEHLKNVYLLDNDVFEAEDFVVLGTTLWTDYDGANSYLMDVAKDHYRGNVRDFKKIKYNRGKNYRKLKPVDVVVEHKKSLSWLQRQFDKYNEMGKEVVVVSHHAPSLRSTSGKVDQKLGVSFDGCYGTDLEDFISKNKPSFWVHGHVHQSQNYFVSNTNILCNPYGYLGTNEVSKATTGFAYKASFTLTKKAA